MSEEIAFGQSVNFTMNHKLGNNTFLCFGLAYQKTPQYFLQIGVIRCLYQRIYIQGSWREPDTFFHNNYFASLALNIGVGKSFTVARIVKFTIALLLLYSLKIKAYPQNLYIGILERMSACFIN